MKAFLFVFILFLRKQALFGNKIKIDKKNKIKKTPKYLGMLID